MFKRKVVIAIVSAISFNLVAVDESSQLQLTKIAVFASHKLGLVDLFHTKDGFHVSKNDQLIKIEPCFIDKQLRNLTESQIQGFQKHGYFELKELSDGTYSLKANVRGQGGGPVTAGIFYWLTKSTCYGAAGVAIGVAATTATPVLVAGADAMGTAVGGAAAWNSSFGANW